MEPATWAGRQQWEGLPDDPDGDDSGADPEDADDADVQEEQPAGEHAVLPAEQDALADEGPEPADEFEFGEEEEGSDGEGDDDAHVGEEEDVGSEAEAEAPGEDPAQAADAEALAAEQTIEADTVSLGDSEEAREAALAGLRARAAEHAAKRGITDPGQAKPGDEAEADADGEGDEGPKTISSETAPAPNVPAEGEPSAEEQKAPRAGLWARFVAASFLIIASMATATAVSILVYLTDIAKGLGGLEGLSSQLDEIEGGKAQTFAIIGSDVRIGDNIGADTRGLSDTTMLVRVDPDKNVITQLSIPRDLQVNIPGHGPDKFNAAYSYGGSKLTLEVLRKSILGPDVPIHHVVNVGFTGFADAVDAIDCVYVDVDRHYFNDNSSFGEQYAVIDIEAGYQRLCGLKALQYVRYRHTDDDIVRAARQQAFVREARARVPVRTLYGQRDELIDIFTDYTTSDIDNAPTLVTLAKLMIEARNAQIRQIPFPFTSLNDEGYVTASAEPLRAAVDTFMGVGIDESESDEGDDGGGNEGGNKKGDDEKPDADEPPPAPPMIDATAAAQAQAAVIRDGSEGELKFPLLYPTKLVPNSTITDDSRFFRVDGPGDEIYRGYKFVVEVPGVTHPTSYYGVSGMDWKDAPLFDNPSEERTINGRTFKIYTNAGEIRMVAFERSGIMYWVTNTLENLLSNDEMMAIALSLTTGE